MIDEDGGPSYTEWIGSLDFPAAKLTDPRWAKWLTNTYATHGAISKDATAVVFRFDQMAAAEAAAALLLDDLKTVSDRLPSIDVDVHGGLRITVDGGYTEGSVNEFPTDHAETTVEVVEYVRDQLSQDDSVSWPRCSRHDSVYLHAMVHGGVAVWWCKFGDHFVASVGELRRRRTYRPGIHRRRESPRFEHRGGYIADPANRSPHFADGATESAPVTRPNNPAHSR